MMFNKITETYTIVAGQSVTDPVQCRGFVHLGVFATSSPVTGSKLRLELSPDNVNWVAISGLDATLSPDEVWSTAFGGLQLGLWFRLRTVDGSGDPVNQSSDLDLVCCLTDQGT